MYQWSDLWECPHKHQRCALPFWELLSAVPSTAKVNSTLAILETSPGELHILGPGNAGLLRKVDVTTVLTML